MCWRARIICRPSRASARYDRDLLDRAAWGRRRERRLFEYWAHEASLLPLALHPLLRWRMARGRSRRVRLEEHARLRRVSAAPRPRRCSRGSATRGRMAASRLRHGKSRGGWWDWGETKHALEWLFWAGHVTTATRRGSFERVYDLTERVIPRSDPGTCRRRTKPKRSARWSRFPPARSASRPRPIFATISGSASRDARPRSPPSSRTDPAAGRGRGLAPARLPSRRARASAPDRRPGAARALRSADLGTRPRRAPVRLPLSHRDLHARGTSACTAITSCLSCSTTGLVARVDLKADRQLGKLVARSVHYEPAAPTGAADRLAAELESMAEWLGLAPSS